MSDKLWNESGHTEPSSTPMYAAIGKANPRRGLHSFAAKVEWEKQPLHKATWKHSAGNTFLSKT